MNEPSEIEALIGEAERLDSAGVRDMNQWRALVRRLIAALREAQKTIETLDRIRVEDHVWFDYKCHKDGCQSLVLQAELARLREALGQADACFEAALVEGWNEALANGDVDLIRDIYNRRIAFARAALQEMTFNRDKAVGSYLTTMDLLSKKDAELARLREALEDVQDCLNHNELANVSVILKVALSKEADPFSALTGSKGG
jgi:hypothetical protein